MATDITLRQTKGAPLTHDELDANFANLKETADLAYDAVAGVGGKANAAVVGTDADATDLGTFTGSTISDNTTAKGALQELETALESTSGSAATKTNATAIGIAATDDDMGTTPGGILSDNGTAKTWFQELEGAVESIPDAGLRTDLAGPDGAALSGFRPDGSGAVAGDVQAKLRRFISLSEYDSATQATAAAYANDALLWLKRGETAKLVCNPTAGDNLQTMCQWAAGAHFIEEGASLYVEIADGLHDVSTYVDITDKRLLDVRATAIPDQLIVTSATFSGVSGVVTVTINVDPSTPLPARVVAGFAVGGMNIQGDGGADMLNTGMIVKARNSNTQFTADIRSSGTNLAAFTTPDNTASLGLTPNRLIVPFCTIRCAEAGWDGAAREAFMNALTGGRIHLTYVGIAYNGITGDNDILFARDAGSEIYLKDYCVIAGAGEMITRAFNQGNIITNRSCLGGGSTGVNVFQGSGGGKASFTRTMMGSVSGDAISSSSGCAVQIGNCVIAGANQILRTVNPDASIIATSSRISRATNGVVPTNGRVSIDANSTIAYCTSPIIVSGSAQGTVYGNPTLTGNTNAAPTTGQISTSGGVWLSAAGKQYDPTFYKVGVFTGSLDFPSIAANTFSDLTVACSGAAFNDFCLVQRSGSTEPSQGIVFRAFVSAADVVTVRAYNITTGAIDPTLFTGRVLVIRAS